jgi:hypothetical protein
MFTSGDTHLTREVLFFFLTPNHLLPTSHGNIPRLLPYFLEPDGKVVLPFFFLTWMINPPLSVRHRRENPFMNTTSRPCGNFAAEMHVTWSTSDSDRRCRHACVTIPYCKLGALAFQRRDQYKSQTQLAGWERTQSEIEFDVLASLPCQLPTRCDRWRPRTRCARGAIDV